MRKFISSTMVSYFIASLFSILFSWIYLSFVPGVYESFLIGLWFIPFLLGFVPFTVIHITHRTWQKHFISEWVQSLYHSGVAVLTVYTALQGIYNIALADVPSQPYFFATGLTFILLSILLGFIYRKKLFNV